MAEFTAVMRQAQRMCKQHVNSCTGCPVADQDDRCLFGPGDCDYIPEEWRLDKLSEVEHIVMQWAAEHPEPRYPSWNEAWKQLFPAAKCIPCPANHFGVDRKCEHNCVECKNRPMTADIAEKLGIKPIGGTNNG